MLEIRDLRKIYADGTEGLKGVSMEIPPGETFAILGTSGAGKTTLLQCLAGFLEPSSGSILLDGRDIRTIPRTEFRRGLGVVFQQLNLFPHLTALQNLTLAPVRVYGEAPAAAADRARALLADLDIAALADSYPARLSGGQAQRVAIARALILEPSYLLLDEPTSALDKNTTQALADLLDGLRTRTTMVFVTHDIPFARALARNAVLMKGGLVSARGTVAELEESWEA